MIIKQENPEELKASANRMHLGKCFALYISIRNKTDNTEKSFFLEGVRTLLDEFGVSDNMAEFYDNSTVRLYNFLKELSTLPGAKEVFEKYGAEFKEKTVEDAD